MASEWQRWGVALVVSGPSGVGKSTLCQQLLETDEGVAFSVSCTTRPPRQGEVDGRDYHFVSTAEFEERAAAGEFVEWAQVHDHYYGTLKVEMEEQLQAGQDMVLDIDVQGAGQIRRVAGDGIWARCTVSVFVGPPSAEELERRLRHRGTDDERAIRRRLHNARQELREWRDYDYLLINRSVAESSRQLQAILYAERLAAARVVPAVPWD